MLLAIDIGNSDVVFGVNKDGKWIHQFRIPSNFSRQSSDFESKLRLLFLENNLRINEFEKVIISSVVPDLTMPINDMVVHYFNLIPIIIGPSIYHKLPIGILRPTEIGTDLVCNALYAFTKYKSNCIVVDFGTALTYSVVGKSGEIIGVSIAPGIKTAIKSLFSNTAQLPEVPIEVPKTAIGKNTVEAIQAGIMWGYIGMVEKMVSTIKSEIGGEFKVIATGGLSTKLTELAPIFNEINVFVTLEGMKIISEI